MRTYGQPSGQLFPKSTQNPNRAKSIMNEHKVKHHRNYDSKTGKIDHTKTTALDEMNFLGGGGGGLNLVFRRQTQP